VRILFVASHPPLPLDNGGRIRTFHLARELASRHETRFISLDLEPGGDGAPVLASDIEEAIPALESAATVRAPAPRKRLRQLSSVVGSSSYTMAMHRSRALRAAVGGAAMAFEPDLVHVDSLFAAGTRLAASTATWVLSLHNDEALLKARLAETAGDWPRRLIYSREAEALQIVQAHELSLFDHAVTVSESEAESARAHNPSVFVAPNGVDPFDEPDVSRFRRPRDERDPLRLLFVGSLNYEPNRQGLEWFINEVAPLARQRLRIDIEVVGPGRRGPELPGVRYLGRVDNLDAAYGRADAAVVPLRAGAGSRLKVVEALARGVPLVSTSIGAEGYDLADGVHALIADTPQAMVERLALLDNSLRTDARIATSIVEDGYDLAVTYFWPGIGERLADRYATWAMEPPDMPEDPPPAAGEPPAG
jgi:glycosyltransferase involved in cell wall biosynthesis